MFRTCLGMLLLVCICQSSFAQGGKLDANVAKLLQERLTLLRESADLQQKNYDLGRVTFSDLVFIRQQVAAAELELAATPADRLQARESLLKHARELEAAVKARFDEGLVSSLDLKMAQAARLRAEADLLLERQAAPR
jgi:outer membrane protein TolC